LLPELALEAAQCIAELILAHGTGVPGVSGAQHRLAP